MTGTELLAYLTALQTANPDALTLPVWAQDGDGREGTPDALTIADGPDGMPRRLLFTRD